MGKYRIATKRDFGPQGFWISGNWVRRGFVVTKDGCNCMPAATWFRTEAEAMKAIEVWEHVQYDATEFWIAMQWHRTYGAHV